VDAKDYKADTGEIIAGTKDATDDDFVSNFVLFLNFCRVFIIFLVVLSSLQVLCIPNYFCSMCASDS